MACLFFPFIVKEQLFSSYPVISVKSYLTTALYLLSLSHTDVHFSYNAVWPPFSHTHIVWPVTVGVHYSLISPQTLSLSCSTQVCKRDVAVSVILTFAVPSPVFTFPGNHLFISLNDPLPGFFMPSHQESPESIQSVLRNPQIQTNKHMTNNIILLAWAVVVYHLTEGPFNLILRWRPQLSWIRFYLISALNPVLH